MINNSAFIWRHDCYFMHITLTFLQLFTGFFHVHPGSDVLIHMLCAQSMGGGTQCVKSEECAEWW